MVNVFAASNTRIVLVETETGVITVWSQPMKERVKVTVSEWKNYFER